MRVRPQAVVKVTAACCLSFGPNVDTNKQIKTAIFSWTDSDAVLRSQRSVL